MSPTVTFRFSRGDWVAMSTEIARKPLVFRLATVVAVLGAMVIALGLFTSGAPDGGSLLGEALKGGERWYSFYAFALLAALGLVFRHRLVGFNAAAGFARMPLADRDLTVVFDEEDVHATADGFDWRFPWSAVVRLIETPTHLVLATGGRQGLPIPHRAFAGEADRIAFRDFAVAHASREASHELA